MLKSSGASVTFQTLDLIVTEGNDIFIFLVILIECLLHYLQIPTPCFVEKLQHRKGWKIAGKHADLNGARGGCVCNGSEKKEEMRAFGCWHCQGEAGL